MRAGASKGKGSSYERHVCKLLSLWITHGKLDDCLWRSSLSGGRATVAHRKDKVVRQAGDICAVSPEGHALDSIVFIECKHVKSLALEGFFISGKNTLANFWRVAVQQAKRHNKTPLLIARQNRLPDLILQPPGGLKQLTGTNRIPGMVIRVDHKDIHCEVRLLEDLLKVPFNLMV